MKKISIYLTFWMVLFSTSVCAQDETPPSEYGIDEMNSIHLELFGTGGLLSLHYERMFNENFGLRGGVGYFRSVETEGMSVPVLLNCLIGDGAGNYELGIGGVYLDVAGDDDAFFGVTDSGLRGALFIGYRYEDNGVVIRLGFAPIFSSDEFYPYCSMSWGAAF